MLMMNAPTQVAVADRRVRSARARFGDAAAYSLQRALADLHRTMVHLQVGRSL